MKTQTQTQKMSIAVFLLGVGLSSNPLYATVESHLVLNQEMQNKNIFLKKLVKFSYHSLIKTDIKAVSLKRDDSFIRIAKRQYYKGEKINLKRVAGPSAMFRSPKMTPTSMVGGASPLAGTPPVASDSKNHKKLKLKAKGVPAGATVIWRIKGVSQISGNNTSVRLPKGKHTVQLVIGKYTAKRVVNISTDKDPVPVVISVNAGRLVTNISIAGSGSSKVQWEIYAIKGGRRDKKILRIRNAKSVKQVLKAGKYEVVATLGNTSQSKKVTVISGKNVSTKLNLAVATVRLIATKDSAPAMASTKWKVFHLKAGGEKVVAKPTRHTAVLQIAPGRYKAIATIAGVTREKMFSVKAGSNSKVIVAMD